MTTEEAIRKFEIIRNTTEKVLASNSNPFVKECEQFYREQKQMAEMALSALRAKQDTKWISVKDRLPEDDQEVILCTRETETYGKHREKKKIYKNIYIGYFDGYEWLTSYCHGCEYIFKMNEKYPNETIEVTHWMPLPKPQQEERT